MELFWILFSHVVSYLIYKVIGQVPCILVFFGFVFVVFLVTFLSTLFFLIPYIIHHISDILVLYH